MNELVFIFHSTIISVFALGALFFGASALVAFICVISILANLFVVKQTTLFGLNATCADAYTIGATLGLNLLQEYYGRPITRKSIFINFFFLIFYAIISQVHLQYNPSIFDTMQPHYVSLLSFMPRIVIASFTVYLIAQTIDYFIYGALKYWTTRFIAIRNFISISLSQLVDTILFSFLGLYGIVENIWHVIIISYLIKLGAIIISSPFVIISKKYFKRNISNNC